MLPTAHTDQSAMGNWLERFQREVRVARIISGPGYMVIPSLHGSMIQFTARPAGGSTLPDRRRFELVSDEENHLECLTLAGTAVQVAKPWALQQREHPVGSSPYPGLTIKSYTDSEHRTLMTTVPGPSGAPKELTIEQTVNPPYFAGASIYADAVREGVAPVFISTSVGFATLGYIDGNPDARRWVFSVNAFKVCIENVNYDALFAAGGTA